MVAWFAPFRNKVIKYFQIPHEFIFCLEPKSQRCYMQYKLFAENSVYLPALPKFDLNVEKSIPYINVPILSAVGGLDSFADNFNLRSKLTSGNVSFEGNSKSNNLETLKVVTDALIGLERFSNEQTIIRMEHQSKPIIDNPLPKKSVVMDQNAENILPEPGYILWFGTDSRYLTTEPKFIDFTDEKLLKRAKKIQTSATKTLELVDQKLGCIQTEENVFIHDELMLSQAEVNWLREVSENRDYFLNCFKNYDTISWCPFKRLILENDQSEFIKQQSSLNEEILAKTKNQAQLLLVKKDQANIKDDHDEIVQYTNTKPTGVPTITRTTKTKNSATEKGEQGKRTTKRPNTEGICNIYTFMFTLSLFNLI